MKTKIAILVGGLLFPLFNFAQITTNNTQTVEWYVQNVLVGTGVTISNVQYNGGTALVSNPSVGEFGNLPSGADVGLIEGMIMGSGNITMASQPNTGGGSSSGGTGAMGVDVDLQSITANQIYDECIVEFDFIPDGDSIKFNYVFASEEYEEYVCGTVNDAFGFFLSGPNPAGGSYTAQNVALIPDPTSWPTLVYTSTGVSINSVNPGVAGFSGTASTCAAVDPLWTTYNIFYTQNTTSNYEYDGRTIALPVAVPVVCGQTYHIKLAIGDGGDSAFDSGVFLEKGSFTSLNAVNVTADVANGDTVLYEGCNEAYFAFSRPDTTVDFIVYFDVTGTATMGSDYSNIPDSLELPSGVFTDTIFIFPLVDGIVEPTETIIIQIYYLNCLGLFDTISATLIITDFVPLTATMNIPPVDPCLAPDSLLVNLAFTGGGSLDSLSWDMGNGTVIVDDTLVNYYYTTQGTYYIEMYARDVCGNDTTLYDTVVYIANYTLSNAVQPPDQMLCDPPYDVFFDAGLPAPPIAYWDFGDGVGSSSVISPTYTYADTGTYTVMYIAIDSSTCNIADTVYMTVIIEAPETLTASIDIPYVDPCLAPDSLLVHMEFTGSGADSIHWDMGNGVTFINDTVVDYYYTTNGVYIITMYAEDVCGNTAIITDTLSYIAAVTATNAIPPPDQLLCDPPFDVTFDGGTPPPPMAYWDFGDASGISTLINPLYTYADTGTYTVMFVAIDSSTCNIADTAYMTVVIEQAETFAAQIAFDPPPPCGTDTMFVDLAFTGSGADSLIWDMGDGNVYTSISVNHFYTTPGTYTITMEAYDLLCNKSEIISQTINFLGPQIFEVIVPNVFTPNGDGVNDVVRFEDADPNGAFLFIVWNRWGKKVYESENQSLNWNGKKENGRELENGLYYYELTYKDQCSGEDEQTKTGYIHLMTEKD
ncbi:MAG: choice-of-anchor L domain-containing protein [Flavobacteriales bacterium]|nr:choice-of-anchor L domain-containing protein [Flavobacteriales bacterium]